MLRFITHAGHQIAMRDEGAGAPVLLAHSSLASKDQWRKMFAAAPPGYRLIAPDRFGHGQSSAWVPPSGGARHRFEDQSDMLAACLADIAEPIHLVGHSFGGAVCMSLALAAPARFASLTLYEPVRFALFEMESGSKRARAFEAWRDAFFSAFDRGDPASAARQFIEFWNGAGAWDGMAAEQRTGITRMMPGIVHEWHAIIGDSVPVTAWSRLQIPTLILAGTLSPPAGRRPAEKLAEIMPHAKLQQVEGAGHMGPMTHADAVNAAILAHIRANG